MSVTPLSLSLVGAVGLSIVAAIATTPATPSPPVQAPPAIQLVLVGDSTVTDDSGWGAGLRKLATGGLEVVNTAANGRSSRSFIDEGLWAAALAKRGQYYLIQFGHNDEPGKGAERETDPRTTYRAFMARYIDEARAIGAKPVLVTSLVRRIYHPDGTIRTTQTAYVEAVRALAIEKQVPLVDLHAISLADAETAGDAVWADRSPRDANGQVDRTHLNARGGEVVGRMVAEALRHAVPELAPYFQLAMTPPAPFRIIGYYSLRAAMAADPAAVPFDRLTHVNLSFLNPDADGTFPRDFSALAPFIAAAHRSRVKVLASIGGGGAHSYYHALLKDDQRGLFIERLVGTAVKYDLDGIDVDLEGSDIDGNYEPFVVDLGSALRARGKLMTSAIAVFYKDALSDRALAQYDFVNIMAYDHTGPWRPEKPGPHSTYEHASTALEYFGVTRHIPREKMVLGVPFYGYGYGPELTSPAVTMTFGEIAAAFAGSELVDQCPLPGGKTIYYNGIPTIKLKTALAREKASGIMIWQILGDAAGDKSLLAAINDAAAAPSR